MKHKHKKYNTIRRRNQRAMWKLLLVATLTGITSIIFPFALDVLKPSNSIIPTVRVHKNEVQAENKPETMQELITRIASEMNFKYTDYLLRLAYCESRFDPNAVNDKNNKPTHSVDRGLFQINNYWHKDVTDAQAFDPEFATRWTIEKINQGKQHYWVCDKYIRANPDKYRP